jgi:hypothetical protein
MQRSLSMFWGLLDISFSEFVTESVIRILYIVLVVLGLIALLTGVVVIFANIGISEGVGALILAPVVYFLFIVIIRVFLEFFIVIFRIADYLEELVENAREQTEME